MRDSSSPSPPPANAGPTAAGPANICGVYLDLAYPVVEALLLTLPAAAAAGGSSVAVDNGGSSSGGVRTVRLLRLQCPWGAGGLWHGAWSPGSPEWEQHAGLPHGAALHTAVANDDSMFWMSYDDFVQVGFVMGQKSGS